VRPPAVAKGRRVLQPAIDPGAAIPVPDPGGEPPPAAVPARYAAAPRQGANPGRAPGEGRNPTVQIGTIEVVVTPSAPPPPAAAPAASPPPAATGAGATAPRDRLSRGLPARFGLRQG
jgi:hypothetical protein